MSENGDGEEEGDNERLLDSDNDEDGDDDSDENLSNNDSLKRSVKGKRKKLAPSTSSSKSLKSKSGATVPSIQHNSNGKKSGASSNNAGSESRNKRRRVSNGEAKVPKKQGNAFAHATRMVAAISLFGIVAFIIPSHFGESSPNEIGEADPTVHQRSILGWSASYTNLGGLAQGNWGDLTFDGILASLPSLLSLFFWMALSWVFMHLILAPNFSSFFSSFLSAPRSSHIKQSALIEAERRLLLAKNIMESQPVNLVVAVGHLLTGLSCVDPANTFLVSALNTKEKASAFEQASQPDDPATSEESLLIDRAMAILSSSKPAEHKSWFYSSLQSFYFHAHLLLLSARVIAYRHVPIFERIERVIFDAHYRQINHSGDDDHDEDHSVAHRARYLCGVISRELSLLLVLWNAQTVWNLRSEQVQCHEKCSADHKTRKPSYHHTLNEGHIPLDSVLASLKAVTLLHTYSASSSAKMVDHDLELDLAESYGALALSLRTSHAITEYATQLYTKKRPFYMKVWGQVSAYMIKTGVKYTLATAKIHYRAAVKALSLASEKVGNPMHKLPPGLVRFGWIEKDDICEFVCSNPAWMDYYAMAVIGALGGPAVAPISPLVQQQGRALSPLADIDSDPKRQDDVPFEVDGLIMAAWPIARWRLTNALADWVLGQGSLVDKSGTLSNNNQKQFPSTRGGSMPSLHGGDAASALEKFTNVLNIAQEYKDTSAQWWATSSACLCLWRMGRDSDACAMFWRGRWALERAASESAAIQESGWPCSAFGSSICKGCGALGCGPAVGMRGASRLVALACLGKAAEVSGRPAVAQHCADRATEIVQQTCFGEVARGQGSSLDSRMACSNVLAPSRTVDTSNSALPLLRSATSGSSASSIVGNTPRKSFYRMTGGLRRLASQYQHVHSNITASATYTTTDNNNNSKSFTNINKALDDEGDDMWQIRHPMHQLSDMHGILSYVSMLTLAETRLGIHLKAKSWESSEIAAEDLKRDAGSLRVLIRGASIAVANSSSLISPSLHDASSLLEEHDVDGRGMGRTASALDSVKIADIRLKGTQWLKRIQKLLLAYREVERVLRRGRWTVMSTLAIPKASFGNDMNDDYDSEDQQHGVNETHVQQIKGHAHSFGTLSSLLQLTANALLGTKEGQKDDSSPVNGVVLEPAQYEEALGYLHVGRVMGMRGGEAERRRMMERALEKMRKTRADGEARTIEGELAPIPV